MNYNNCPRLTPYSQQPLREPSLYQQFIGFQVDATQVASESSSSYTGIRKPPLPCPTDTIDDGRTAPEVAATLKPYAYARPNSRDTSEDASSTRQMM